MTDTAITADAPEMLSAVELILLSAERRFGRIANALERTASHDIDGLTKQVHRIADALDSISEVLRELTAKATGTDDGVTRRTLRTCDFSPLALTTYGHGEN